jgi:hypothetical protein
MGLGAFSAKPGEEGLSLAKARAAAEEARVLLRRKQDPIEARERDIAALRAAAAEAYIAAHAITWRNPVHRRQWQQTLTQYAFPSIGAVPVAEVDSAGVLVVLEPIWTEKPETASRLRGRIEAVLDFAATKGWRGAENPARWKGQLKFVLPARARVAEVRHHPALPWAQLPAFYHALQQQPGASAPIWTRPAIGLGLIVRPGACAEATIRVDAVCRSSKLVSYSSWVNG